MTNILWLIIKKSYDLNKIDMHNQVRTIWLKLSTCIRMMFTSLLGSGAILEICLRVGVFPKPYNILGLYTSVYTHKQSRSILKNFDSCNLYKT